MWTKAANLLQHKRMGKRPAPFDRSWLVFGLRLTNRPCADLVRGRPLVRDAQTSAPGSGAGVRLGPVRVPRTMLPGGCGPRRGAPVRRRGPLSLHLASEPATPPGGGRAGRRVDIRGAAYEHRWQADALGRGRGRPLFGGQGLEPAPPAARHAHLPPRGIAVQIAGGARGRTRGRDGATGSQAAQTKIRNPARRIRPARSPSQAVLNSHRREPGFCYPARCAHCRRSHLGRYHTDRQPGDAAQYTARCPRVPAGAISSRCARQRMPPHQSGRRSLGTCSPRPGRRAPRIPRERRPRNPRRPRARTMCRGRVACRGGRHHSSEHAQQGNAWLRGHGP